MNCIKLKLNNIRDYLNTNRQCGHTKSMIRGAQNTDAVVILARDINSAFQLQRKVPNCRVLSIGSALNTNNLRYMNLPLLVDNGALHLLVDEAICKIESLEKQVEDQSQQSLKDELSKTQARLIQAVAEIGSLRNKLSMIDGIVQENRGT